jgi:hypothetical protein
MAHNMGAVDRSLRAFAVAPAAIVVALLIGAGTVVGIIPLCGRRGHDRDSRDGLLPHLHSPWDLYSPGRTASHGPWAAPRSRLVG